MAEPHLLGKVFQATQWISFEAGLVTVGRDANAPSFFFDTETPAHKQFVEPFEICFDPIMESDVLEIIAYMGYQRRLRRIQRQVHV